MRFAYPGIDDAAILEMVSRRYSSKLRVDTVLTRRVVSAAAEVLGDQTTTETWGEVVACSRKVVVEKVGVPPLKVAAKTYAKKKALGAMAACRRLRAQSRGRVVHAAQDYAPARFPPHSFSAPYNEATPATVRTSLFQALRWA